MLNTIDYYYEVKEYVSEAKAIAWDTCHKIYVLMDDEQVELFRGYGYGDWNAPESLITIDQMGVSELTTVALTWYKQACGLKFIQAIYSNPDNPNEGFVDILGQFAENEDDDDEDDDE